MTGDTERDAMTVEMEDIYESSDLVSDLHIVLM